MTHLIAELVENATAFSPPNTQVEIKADAVAHGFAVEIEDRGLGLSADELAEINERLASPPEFDLADSDQLGLFVVGQLAARHGIRVSLRGSPYGGTIAIVLMPNTIVVRDGESGAQGGLNGNGQGALPLPAGPLPAGPVPASLAPAGPVPAGALPAGPAGADLSRQCRLRAGWFRRVRFRRAGCRTGPPRLESGPSASVFSLTGRHRLDTGLPEDGAGSGPWPAAPLPATPPAPPGPPIRGLASRGPAPRDTRAQAPWEQPSWDQASWDQPSWDRPASDAPSWEHQPWVAGGGAGRPGSPAPAPQPPAAQAPAAAGTHLGMPVRVRQASLAPQLRRRAGPGRRARRRPGLSFPGAGPQPHVRPAAGLGARSHR